MISRFLVNSYITLVELALWLYFIGFAVFGYQAGSAFAQSAGGGASGMGASNFIGAIIALIIAFVGAVLFIAPFLLIEDIRKHVKRIDEAKFASR